MALRFSMRDESVDVETLEVGNLVEFVSGDEEFWLYRLDEVEEPEFERPAYE